jgi:hypothetical protein
MRAAPRPPVRGSLRLVTLTTNARAARNWRSAGPYDHAMFTTFRRVSVAAFAALALATILPGSASAARAPITPCGNAKTADGVLIGDISARRVSCKTARRIARLTPSRCDADGTCTVRGYTCFAARATDELRLARCSKAHGNEELYRTVRFDYGS